MPEIDWYPHQGANFLAAPMSIVCNRLHFLFCGAVAIPEIFAYFLVLISSYKQKKSGFWILSRIEVDFCSMSHEVHRLFCSSNVIKTWVYPNKNTTKDNLKNEDLMINQDTLKIRFQMYVTLQHKYVISEPKRSKLLDLIL